MGTMRDEVNGKNGIIDGSRVISIVSTTTLGRDNIHVILYTERVLGGSDLVYSNLYLSIPAEWRAMFKADPELLIQHDITYYGIGGAHLLVPTAAGALSSVADTRFWLGWTNVEAALFDLDREAVKTIYTIERYANSIAAAFEEFSLAGTLESAEA